MWRTCALIGLVLLFSPCESLRRSKKPVRSEDCPMVEIKGGTFRYGSEAKELHGAAAATEKTVRPFWIDETTVTNERFSKFVDETNFQTEAEVFKWSFVLEPFVPEEVAATIETALQGAEWWLPVEGAYWREPYGPGSSIEDKMDHPVVHISWNDAKAFCAWAGKRLPLDAEWEYAARGGLEKKRYPWGNKKPTPEEPQMNIWEGKFPLENTKEDGYTHTAPANAYGPQNDFGVYNMLGNVWEWCADQVTKGQYALRGGSYLDSVDGSFNHRVYNAVRTLNSADAGADNIGFRCASSVAPPSTASPAAEEKSEL
eukprot:Rmarinus@m.7729